MKSTYLQTITTPVEGLLPRFQFNGKVICMH